MFSITSSARCLSNTNGPRPYPPDCPPAGFDPGACPIISRHFFGIELRRQFDETAFFGMEKLRKAAVSGDPRKATVLTVHVFPSAACPARAVGDQAQ